MNIFETIKSNTTIKDITRLYPHIVFDQGKAKSPFRPEERTPSFVMNEAKNIVSCFSTGRLGLDIISFVSLIENLPLYESAKFIATKLNIPIEEGERSYWDIFFDGRLEEDGLKFLEARGINNSLAKKYKLTQKNNYLYIPILSGTTMVGYNARVLSGDGPKYKLSQGFAKENIKPSVYGQSKVKTYVLVEGQLDAILGTEYGLTTIPLFGSYLMDSYLKYLINNTYISSVVLALDNDKAGVDAILQTFKRLSSFDLQLFAYDYLDCKDLNEYLVKYKEVPSMIPVSRILPNASLDCLLDLIKGVSNPQTRQSIIQDISDRFDIPVKEIIYMLMGVSI